MNVYAGPEGRRRLLGQARVPWDHGPILVVRATREQFAIHAIRCPGEAGGIVETAVLLSPGQRPDLLPGWRPTRMEAVPPGLAGFIHRLAQAMLPRYGLRITEADHPALTRSRGPASRY